MKYFKKVLLILLSASLLLSSAACGNADDEKEETKTVVVGTCADHPPYAYHVTVDGVDTITGSDIELAKKIADEAKYNLEIKDFSHNELLKQLDLGNLDFIVATMPELADNEDVLASKSYGEDVLACMTTGAAYSDASALAGKTVGLLQGTTQTELDALKLPESAQTATYSATDLIDNLKNGKISAAVLPESLAKAYQAKDSAFKTAFTVSAGSMHIIVRYTNNIFLETINDAIKHINQTQNIPDFLQTSSAEKFVNTNQED
jgi:ABC-type amino acid transport substrate-binding protein